MTFKKWSSERTARLMIKPGDKDAPQPAPAVQPTTPKPDKTPAEPLPRETS
jgi:hypothetical protein